MARLVGLDISQNHIRVAVLRANLRGFECELLLEADIEDGAQVSKVLSETAGGSVQHGESIAVGFDGTTAFFHRIDLPKTAARKLDEVLPYEVEAKLPLDIEEVVFGWRVLAKGETVQVLTASARIDAVKSQIEMVRDALGREPDRVSCGVLPLGNLAPWNTVLSEAEPVLVIHLGKHQAEFAVMKSGDPWCVRHVRWTSPVDLSKVVAAARQTMASWMVDQGELVREVRLTGDAPDIAEFESQLALELSMEVEWLEALNIVGLEGRSKTDISKYAKALGTALGLRGKARGLDLRQGPLTLQRSYGYLKEKTPVLAGLLGAVVISFGFSLWAESASISREREALTGQLSEVTAQVLGTALDDPDVVEDVVQRRTLGSEKDPMPPKDAFDMLLMLSEVIPNTITHEIRDFSLQRDHVKVNGTVDTTEEAQAIVMALSGADCVKDVKTGAITRQVNSNRQKYSVEFALDCGGPKAVAKEGRATP